MKGRRHPLPPTAHRNPAVGAARRTLQDDDSPPRKRELYGGGLLLPLHPEGPWVRMKQRKALRAATIDARHQSHPACRIQGARRDSDSQGRTRSARGLATNQER
ncbi:hypothetical protein ALC57_16421 [Trachymyrmex cornetzi]|uniref:Uncharacterized protein n=1 Tax=Trachymyrmex cornetzi TaxID=471704 RepID=A0A151IV63_9HYME|nr:hypothetical protein ALC57_16421 [Trachymyrmex cornetzi]